MMGGRLVAHRPKARLLQQVAEGALESAGQQVDVQHQVIVLITQQPDGWRMVPIGIWAKSQQVLKGPFGFFTRDIEVRCQRTSQKRLFSALRKQAVAFATQGKVGEIVPALGIDDLDSQQSEPVNPATLGPATEPWVRVQDQATADRPSQEEGLDALKSTDDQGKEQNAMRHR